MKKTFDEKLIFDQFNPDLDTIDSRNNMNKVSIIED